MELFSKEIFNKAKGKTLLPYICDVCGKYDVRSKRGFQYGYRGKNKHQCCSKKCSSSIHSKNNTYVDVNCAECNTKITKYTKDVKRNKNNFCSKSCAAKYNNRIYIKRPKNNIVIDLRKEKTIQKTESPETTRKRKYLKLCINCKCEYHGMRIDQKYCSLKCQSEYQRNEKINQWKLGEIEGWSGKTFQLKSFVRSYIKNKYDNKCSKCGWNEIHPITGNVPIEINHIDGNPQNCKEDNLEVLCPNCHSLTYNFRALNKNSCRIRK
jgi:hypothetical protein